MPGEFERLTGIVDEYLRRNPRILDHPEVHGVFVRYSPSGNLDVVIHADQPDRVAALQDEVDAGGAFTIDGEPLLNPGPQVLHASRATWAKSGTSTGKGKRKKKTVPKKKVRAGKGAGTTAALANCRKAAGARGGSPIKNDKASSEGTAGWIFELNGRLVCLSNCHVLATDNPAETACQVEGVDATLTAQVKPDPNRHDNSWDYAIAAIGDEDNNKAVGEMSHPNGKPSCNAMPNHDYPRRLSDDTSANTKYWKVGKTTGCTHGSLVYVGTKWIGEFNDPTKHPKATLPPIAGFKGVLGFDLVAGSGDSGSVIIREDDNSVVGLLFAKDPGGTIAWANPLFKAGWTKLDEDRAVGCGAVPRFSSPGGIMKPPDLP